MYPSYFNDPVKRQQVRDLQGTARDWNSSFVWVHLPRIYGEDGNYVYPRVWEFMTPYKINLWNHTPNSRLFKIWSLLRPAGFLFPVTPNEFEDLILTKNRTRTTILLRLLRKIYPSDEYWTDPIPPEKADAGPPGEYVAWESEIRLEKVKNVCKWFGFSQDEGIIEGNGNVAKQFYLWFNILATYLDVKTQQRQMAEHLLIPSCQLVREFLVGNNNIYDLMADRPLLCRTAPASYETKEVAKVVAAEGARIERAYESVLYQGDWFSPRRGKLTEKYRALIVGLHRYLEMYSYHFYLQSPGKYFVPVRPVPRFSPEYGIRKVRTSFIETSLKLRKFIDCIQRIKAMEWELQDRMNNSCPECNTIMRTPEWTVRISGELNLFEPSDDLVEPIPALEDPKFLSEMDFLVGKVMYGITAVPDTMNWGVAWTAEDAIRLRKQAEQLIAEEEKKKLAAQEAEAVAAEAGTKIEEPKPELEEPQAGPSPK